MPDMFLDESIKLETHTHTHIHIYIYIYTHTQAYINYVYTYTHRQKILKKGNVTSEFKTTLPHTHNIPKTQTHTHREEKNC